MQRHHERKQGREGNYLSSERMPSLRFRRMEQIRQGNVTSRTTSSSYLPSPALSREELDRTSSMPSVDSLRKPNSTDSVIAFRAGLNSLDRGADGCLRPGGLVATDAPSHQQFSVVVDAAEAVAHAPNSACRGLQSFVPQWKATANARSRYHKPLQERYFDGSLYQKTHLARSQALRSSAPAWVPRARSYV